METARWPMPNLYLCLSHSSVSSPSLPHTLLVRRRDNVQKHPASLSGRKVANKYRSEVSCNSGKNPRDTERSVNPDFPDNSSRPRKVNLPGTSISLSPAVILTQAVIVLFTLGFIDAGYSGDWSRIGVITKGTEDLLKIGAIVVVPLSIFLVISLFRSGRSDEV